jgi:hypothetical protein
MEERLSSTRSLPQQLLDGGPAAGWQGRADAADAGIMYLNEVTA